MSSDLPSAAAIRAVCDALQNGVNVAPRIIEHTGYSKRVVWMVLQWLRAEGHVDIVEVRGMRSTPTGRPQWNVTHQHRLLSLPSVAIMEYGPNAVRKDVAPREPWDFRALRQCWDRPVMLPVGCVRTVMLGEAV